MNKEFKRGDQVAYVPDHANGDISHIDVDFGFVATIYRPKSTFVFVRYWSKHSPNELRTKANSEATLPINLAHYSTKPQEEIDELLKTL